MLIALTLVVIGGCSRRGTHRIVVDKIDATNPVPHLVIGRMAPDEDGEMRAHVRLLNPTGSTIEYSTWSTEPRVFFQVHDETEEDGWSTPMSEIDMCGTGIRWLELGPGEFRRASRRVPDDLPGPLRLSAPTRRDTFLSWLGFEGPSYYRAASTPLPSTRFR